MPNQVNIYEPRFLAEVVRTAPPLHTFFLDSFFTNVRTFSTKRVDIDIVKGDRRMAAFVHPRVGGTVLKGNGYLAVYIAGMMVGNHKIMYRKEIYTFMDGLSWLFQIIMFLCLGLLVNPHEMLIFAPVALLIGAFMILAGRPLSVFICLLPFGRKITLKSRLFISWVGLRGAVPIIFATYPVVEGVPGASIIFNIVFFITILSLIIQGTTISRAARVLGLSLPMEKTGNDFGVELPDEIDSNLRDMTVSEATLQHGNTLKDMNLPQGTLVMIVKRGDEYLIPNGSLQLHIGDKLLLISENGKSKSRQDKNKQALA